MPSYDQWCDFHGGRICKLCSEPSVADYCTDCWKFYIAPGSALGPPTTPKRNDEE